MYKFQNVKIVIEIVKRWWEQDCAHMTIISKIVVLPAKKPLSWAIKKMLLIDFWRKINLFRSILSGNRAKLSLNGWNDWNFSVGFQVVPDSDTHLSKAIRFVLVVSKLTYSKTKTSINKWKKSRDCNIFFPSLSFDFIFY